MNNVFNRLHTLKSSEDCNKYSKSVSYETLVGGTTTTGRGIKQTRRVFLSSADKPLSAVGTLTSLLCNSAKVMEKLLYRHSEPKVKNPKKTGTVIIGRGCETIISAESKRDPRLIATQSPRMTDKALSFLRLRGAGKKQKESSLILRKAKFQAIFEFVLSSASGGAGGGKYKRISAFVSMPVLLIRRSLEFFNSLASYARDSLIFATQKRNDGNMKNRDDRLFSGFAKILAFAFIFTLITTAESRADDVIPTSGTCNDAGTCLWSLGSDGTLTISAKDGAEDVKMANYSCYDNPCDQSTLISRPWEASLQQIKSVVIGDNITHIGDDAFQNASNLTSVTGMKDVKTIGDAGVFAYTGLTSITIPDSVTSIGDGTFKGAESLESITIPDSVTSIGAWAFQNAYDLTSITIPEGVTSIGNGAFWSTRSLESIIIPDNIDTKNWSAGVFNNLPANTKIVCQGDLNTCYENLAKYIPTDKGGSCTEYCIKKEIQPALFDSCKSTNYFWDGSTCIREPDVTKRKCCISCKDMGGWCNRIQYTPAEAAQVLRDDNTNSVTITFKK